MFLVLPVASYPRGKWLGPARQYRALVVAFSEARDGDMAGIAE